MKSNSVMVPEAKEAMERFKMESASEVDVQNRRPAAVQNPYKNENRACLLQARPVFL